MSRVDGARWRCKDEDCAELVEQSEMEDHLIKVHNAIPYTPEVVWERFVLAIGSPSRGYYRRGKGEDETDSMFPEWRERRMFDKEDS